MQLLNPWLAPSKESTTLVKLVELQGAPVEMGVCSADDQRKPEQAHLKAAKQEVEKAEATMSTMLVLMANLAESPIMQSSPSASHLLTIPLNEEDQETNAAWRTAESFLDSVKVSVPADAQWAAQKQSASDVTKLK